MTATEPSAATSISAALDRVRRAMHWADLEPAWIDGLRHCKHPDDRDRIMVAAGRRLQVFDDVPDDWLRLRWLSDTGVEVQMRGDQGLGPELGALAVAELREASARISDCLDALRESATAGESVREWARNNVAAANRIRDLGRVAKKLDGAGLLALVPAHDIELATRLADEMASGGRLRATVPESLRVRREDLLTWAKRPETAPQLPVLLHRLIDETAAVERIRFPSGAAVAVPGWDGIVRSEGGNRFVPAGDSCWEISAQQSGSDRKARDDYAKRVEQVESERRRGLAYVAVICAPWTKARDFEQEMRARGDFREVRALNVDDLAAWLECAPQATVWLRGQMGKPVRGVGLLSDWWDKWLDTTDPPLDTRIVLAGREREAEKLRDRCHQSLGGVVTVGGHIHRDELVAFIAAALSGSASSNWDLDGVLCLDDPAEARQLLGEGGEAAGPAITAVVPSAEFVQRLPAGLRHRVVVPLPGASQAEIEVAAVDSERVAELFNGTGMDIDDAHRLGSLARVSLMALRRSLAKQPELHRPRWASDRIDRTIRRSLLLGGWDQREGDRQAVEKFMGHPYESVTETLSGLDPGDAPMVSTGELWHAVSPADAWLLLDGQFSRDDIRDFGDLACEVLTEPDPLWGLTGDNRLAAQLEGVRGRYSPQLKQGMATSLALLGSRPPIVRGYVSPSSEAASDIAWSVLRRAQQDPTTRTWWAVSEVLPLLAEAEPEAVVEALRECLSRSHEFARAMFADGASERFGFSARSPHFRVLEALDIVAWSPQYLTGAMDVLARLAEIDPGGQYANRPAERLSSIQCPWMPHTAACDENRLEALQMLRRCHNAAAWPLMLSMLPGGLKYYLHGESPRYRDWRKDEKPVTPQEHRRMVASVAEMLLEDVGEDPDRWAALTEALPALPPDVRRRACAALGRLAGMDTGEALKPKLWPKLRDLVDRHREYRDADWVLPDSDLALIDHLLERLRPADPSAVYGHLFSSGLMQVDDVRAADGWDAFQQALRAKRAEAVGAILSVGGVDAVVEFAGAVEQPYAVGAALADRDSSRDEAVVASMDAAPEATTLAALGYFGQRYADLGWEGLERMIADHSLNPQVAADLLRSPPPAERTRTRVDSFGSEVAAEYWARIGYGDLGVPEETRDLVEVSSRLRDAGRCQLATILLSLGTTDHGSRPEFAEETATCLEQLIKHPSAASWNHNTAQVRLAHLLEVLDRHHGSLAAGRAAAIEWQLLPLLQTYPDLRAPSLYREMARDPALFVRLVELAFRPAGDRGAGRPALTEAQQSEAVNAHVALSGWPESRFAPGSGDASEIDTDLLTEWVERAREHLAAIDRTEVGDTLIGTALEASPPDPDGEWPGIAVRDLLEQLQNDRVDAGLSMAVRNRRGVFRRGLTEGGAQERELAASHRQAARRFGQWPRTAAIFDGLARTYEHEAVVEDREAEAHRRGLPL